MSNNTRYLPFEQYVHRSCFICGNDIDSMHHAITVKAGAGLTACAHASCGASLQDEINELVTYANAKDPNDPIRQYGGVNEPAEPTYLINKPCVVCNQQVMNGTTIDIGGTTYAAHSACKQRMLESIAGSLDAGNLQTNHQASIVRGVGND